MRFCRAIDRHDLIELFPKLGHVPVEEVRSAKMDQAIHLFGYCLYDLGVTMSGRANGYAGIAIEKDVSIRICYPYSFGVVGDKLVIRPRIARRNILRVSVDYLARLWSW
jgi:hypothetical protein